MDLDLEAFYDDPKVLIDFRTMVEKHRLKDRPNVAERIKYLRKARKISE